IMAYELAKILEEAGLPKGILNVVYGKGSQVGDAMVNHDDIRVISFTGSNETGRNIASECGKQWKKVSLEMGGKNDIIVMEDAGSKSATECSTELKTVSLETVGTNAIIVMDDADLDLAVEGIIWSAYGTSGQRCTSASRAIAHEDVKERLEERLLAEIEKLTIGDGLDESNKVDRKSTRLNSSHVSISYAVFCLK